MVQYLEQTATCQCPEGEGQSLYPQRQRQPYKSRRASEPAASSSAAAGSAVSCCWQWFPLKFHKILVLFSQPRPYQSPSKTTPTKKGLNFPHQLNNATSKDLQSFKFTKWAPQRPLQNAKQRPQKKKQSKNRGKGYNMTKSKKFNNMN